MSGLSLDGKSSKDSTVAAFGKGFVEEKTNRQKVTIGLAFVIFTTTPDFL
jgi:hypothetical protein